MVDAGAVGRPPSPAPGGSGPAPGRSSLSAEEEGGGRLGDLELNIVASSVSTRTPGEPSGRQLRGLEVPDKVGEIEQENPY